MAAAALLFGYFPYVNGFRIKGHRITPAIMDIGNAKGILFKSLPESARSKHIHIAGVGFMAAYLSFVSKGFTEAGAVIIPIPDGAYTTVDNLLDKAGREICEGDVVKYDGLKSETCVAKIEYCEGAYELLNKYDGFVTHLCFCRADALEVIGNIYENPNLLTP